MFEVKKMKQIRYKVEKCSECPCISRTYAVINSNHVGEHYCNKAKRSFGINILDPKPNAIPKWCPLEDYKEGV